MFGHRVITTDGVICQVDGFNYVKQIIWVKFGKDSAVPVKPELINAKFVSDDKTKRFFLKATGSTCYDEMGITYPMTIKIKLDLFVQSLGGTKTYWANEFNNLPKILLFNALPADVVVMNSLVYKFGLIVKEVA